MHGSAQVGSGNMSSIEWTGRLTASWCLAGGVAGGLLVPLLYAAGRLHPVGLPAVAAVLAVCGAVLGATHGVILGVLSRPTGEAPARWWPGVVFAVIYTAGAFAMAMLLSVWIATSTVVAATSNPLAAAGLAGAVLVATGSLAWASVLGWRAFEVAYARWPQRRLGTGLITGSFMVLLLGGLAMRPALPGRPSDLSLVGAVLLAALATLWVAAPAVVLGLRRRARRPPANARVAR
jgi:hypothetical protein